MPDVETIIGKWSFMETIGARPSTKPFEPIPIPLLSKTTDILRQGDTISLTDVPEEWKRLPIFLDEHSLPFVFYISDQSWDYKYKFHFKWCRTLENMQREGRIQRYRAKYDICNPAFEINDGHGRATENLTVCKNCCNEFPFVYEFFDANNWNIEKNFLMPEFFEKFGKIDLPSSTHPGGRDGYTRDWPKVAQREKEKAEWICMDCRRDFSHNRKDLHVHHKTGVKSDNVSANLEVVCSACHAKKPGHGHMQA